MKTDIDKDAILKRAKELVADILSSDIYFVIGNELVLNPAAEELNRLASQYDLSWTLDGEVFGLS